MMVIETDNWNISATLDYNKDFKITADGKIKYIGADLDLPDDGKIGNITKICSDKEENASYVEVTEYISIKGLAESDEYAREVVLVEFKVPANAKSGYIWTTEPMHFAIGGYSDEKLIVVDEDGNEIK